MTGRINGMLKRLSRGAVTLATAVALLALPITPMAPLTIRPAKADLAQCLSTVTDAAKAGAEVAENLGDLAKCVANASSGGGAAVEAAVAAVLTSIVIAHNGFPDSKPPSGKNNVGKCEAMIDTVLAQAVAGALADLYNAGGGAKSALDDVFGENTMKQLINAIKNGATSQLNDLIDNSPLSVLTSYITCGCTVVGGSMDALKDIKQVGQDAEACAAILTEAIGAVLDVVASGVEAVGEALEDFGHDVGCIFSDCSNPPKTWEQCVSQYVSVYQGFENLPAAQAQQLAQSTCAARGYEHVGTSAVPDVAAPPLCTAGWHVDFPTTIIGTGDHKPHVVMLPACSCPHSETYLNNTGSQAICICRDANKGYNGKEINGSTCSTCPAGTAPADDGTCQAWTCPSSEPGVAATAKIVQGVNFNECTYSSGCDSGSVDVNGTCQMCGANQHAMYGPPLTINIGNGAVVSKTYPDGPPVGGKCYSCPASSRSDPGSTSCTPFKCSLTEQLSPDGWSCQQCEGKVARYLDADVCESSDGKPLYQPAMQCNFGSALIIDGKNYGGMVYNADDCSPLQCKGLDHPDYDNGGHRCVACKTVAHVPLSAFGLGSSGGGDLMTVVLPDGSAGVKAGGKTYGFTEIPGQPGKLKMTDAGGGLKVVSAAKSASSGTVGICLDGTFGKKPSAFHPIPGLTVYQVPPKMETTKTGLQILIPSYPGGGSGNPDPIAPNLDQTGAKNQQTQTPMSTKQGPGAIPPPGGSAATVPAQGGGSSASLPAQGEGGRPTPRGSKPQDSGGYHTVTVKAHGDDPVGGKKTGTGAVRTGKKPKQDNKGGYKAVTVPAYGDDSDNGGGSGSSKTSRPSLNTTPTTRSTAPTFQRTTPSFSNTTRTLPSFSGPSSTPSGNSTIPRIH